MRYKTFDSLGQIVVNSKVNINVSFTKNGSYVNAGKPILDTR